VRSTTVCSSSAVDDGVTLTTALRVAVDATNVG